MARAGSWTVVAALALLWCCSGGVSAGKQHFVERVIQSQQEQEQRDWQRGPPPDTDQFVAASASDSRRRFTRLQLPPTLGDALAKALSFEANLSRLSGARWRQQSRQESGGPAGRVTGGRITDGRVTGGRITDGRVSGGRVTGGSVTGGSVTDDRVTGGRVTDDRVTGGRVSGGRVSGGRVTDDRVTGGRVSGGRVSGGRVTDDRVTDSSSGIGSDSSGSRTGPWPAVQEPWSGSSTPGPQTGRRRPLMPPLLQSALGTPMFPASDSEHPGTHRPQPGPRLNITETPHGCSCSGVTAAPDRTLSFLMAGLPAPEDADLTLDLHLPIISDPYSPLPAGPATLATRLALCAPGGAGRSIVASLRLKKAPRRREWRHAIISDWLAQLSRRSSAAAGARQGEERCLQVVLPAGAPVILDRSGYRLAHLTTRPPKHRGS